MKTLDEYFCDWEASAFGYGYGTGEPHIIPLLRRFLSLCGEASYDYKEIENELGASNAWFLINVLCREQILEYGSSPRYGWLTERGRALKDYLLGKSGEELLDILANERNICYRDACNCGPNGFQEKKLCPNPFWGRKDT